MKNNKFFSNEIFNVEIDSKTKGVLELNKIQVFEILSN